MTHLRACVVVPLQSEDRSGFIEEWREGVSQVASSRDRIGEPDSEGAVRVLGYIFHQRTVAITLKPASSFFLSSASLTPIDNPLSVDLDEALRQLDDAVGVDVDFFQGFAGPLLASLHLHVSA